MFGWQLFLTAIVLGVFGGCIFSIFENDEPKMNIGERTGAFLLISATVFFFSSLMYATWIAL